MKKKDFELIASVIRELKRESALCMDNRQDIRALAKKFANALATTNSQFNSVRFINACLK